MPDDAGLLSSNADMYLHTFAMLSSAKPSNVYLGYTSWAVCQSSDLKVQFLQSLCLTLAIFIGVVITQLWARMNGQRDPTGAETDEL